ncbi:hypothetical protein I79_011582 [Cricetulus griseus]|uniref:Uncharacterized protein n=1 Tax=Cricetulus griseus TaxID=10029 RepID=G3HLJ4_CRIGR|nr:hypothetical protein I79_011582 [Cricetulus griseus]
MAQRLSALAALPEVLSSIPSNHIHGDSQPSIMRSGALFWPALVYMQTEHYIHNK